MLKTLKKSNLKTKSKCKSPKISFVKKHKKKLAVLGFVAIAAGAAFKINKLNRAKKIKIIEEKIKKNQEKMKQLIKDNIDKTIEYQKNKQKEQAKKQEIIDKIKESIIKFQNCITKYEKIINNIKTEYINTSINNITKRNFLKNKIDKLTLECSFYKNELVKLKQI